MRKEKKEKVVQEKIAEGKSTEGKAGKAKRVKTAQGLSLRERWKGFWKKMQSPFSNSSSHIATTEIAL